MGLSEVVVNFKVTQHTLFTHINVHIKYHIVLGRSAQCYIFGWVELSNLLSIV